MADLLVLLVVLVLVPPFPPLVSPLGLDAVGEHSMIQGGARWGRQAGQDISASRPVWRAGTGAGPQSASHHLHSAPRPAAGGTE